MNVLQHAEETGCKWRKAACDTAIKINDWRYGTMQIAAVEIVPVFDMKDFEMLLAVAALPVTTKHQLKSKFLAMHSLYPSEHVRIGLTTGDVLSIPAGWPQFL